tara:strand:+ start:517 stop:816 length:300 start_codon:yes stop_codon:yes gene_type:complete
MTNEDFLSILHFIDKNGPLFLSQKYETHIYDYHDKEVLEWPVEDLKIERITFNATDLLTLGILKRIPVGIEQPSDFDLSDFGRLMFSILKDKANMADKG